MYEFKLPDLGEGIHEGQIVRILVNEGDSIAEYQPMMEVETDKAAVEIPSPKSGTISKIHVTPGQTVKVGDVMISIDESGNGQEARPAAKPAGKRPEPQSPPVAPRPETPAKREPVVEAAPARAAAEPEATAAPQPAASSGEPVAAAPAVRKLARELGVDIDNVPGSGPGGRILREDVEAFASGERPAARATAGPEGAQTPVHELQVPFEELPDFSKHGPIRREAVPQIRKTIARQMARSWANIPRVTQADEADITELEQNRKAYNEGLREGEARLTTTAIVLRILGAALKRHARVNASYDPQAAEIIYKDYVHVGLAVDTPRGLVVPVIRDVDRKPMPVLAAELRSLSERTRKAQFDISELRGATFTITNYGALGGTIGTPMVNFPEVAILGMGKAKLRPWVHGGQIVARLIMPLSLSFDHRIVDGADAARFLNDVIGALENPLHLLSL